MSSPTYYIMGHGRHGKDTVAELLSRFLKISHLSSSAFACQRIVFPVLAAKYGYASAEDCYNDRHNHRAEWFDAIRAYGAGDPARFSRELFQVTPMYVGIRNAAEFQAARAAGLGDLAIWVDASKRCPPESAESCTVLPEMADIIIDNNGSLFDLTNRVRALSRVLRR